MPFVSLPSILTIKPRGSDKVALPRGAYLKFQVLGKRQVYGLQGEGPLNKGELKTKKCLEPYRTHKAEPFMATKIEEGNVKPTRGKR